MQRIDCQPRQDWKRKLEAHGFTFHSVDGQYWNESAYYRFTEAEIDRIEDATLQLHQVCLDVVGRIIASGRYEPFGLNAEVCNWIERSWKAADPHLYCRFDLAYDGAESIKLLEANADTPTALIESSLSQWFWLEELFPEADQFNSIHEKLIARWPIVAPAALGTQLHLSSMRGHVEDAATVLYLQDCAGMAGLKTTRIDVEDIGWWDRRNLFVDLDRSPITRLFKLYPSEWLVSDKFGIHLVKSGIQLIEPLWKLLLSSKAILPLLWEYHPEHPNLLPAFYGEPPGTGRWVRKPRYSREGANVAIFDSGKLETATSGSYGEQPVISQAWTSLANNNGRYAVIGSWVIGDEPAGIGIREDSGPITRNSSLFVPHLFD